MSSRSHLQKLDKLWKISLIVSENQVQALATANHLTTARRVDVPQTKVIALCNNGRKKKYNSKSTKTRNLSIPKRETRNLRRRPKKRQTKKKHPGLKEECPNHEGHISGDCRLYPRSESYDPPKAYFKNNVQRQNDNYQGQNT